MTDVREPRTIRGRLTGSSAHGHSRLAHWPPPQRGRQSPPLIIRHDAGEQPHRASPRGWRLTRALFSEFSED